MHQTAMATPAPKVDLVTRGPLLPGLLALLMALGSVVFVEPAPYDLLAVLMFFGLLVTGLRFPRELTLPVILIALLITANVLAAGLASDPLQSIRSLSVRIYMLLTFLLIACLIAVRPAQLIPALWVGYLIAALVAVGWGTLEYLGFLPVEPWLNSLRAKGGFKDPNVFGPFLVPAAVYSLGRFATGQLRHISLYVPVFLVLAFGVLLSFSRGAWINMGASLGLYGLLAFLHVPNVRARIHWLLAGVVCLVIVFGTLAAAVSVDAIGEQFYARAVLAQKYDVATGGRFDVQKKVLAHIGTDPIGVGPGRSDEEFGLEPHNVYLHMLVESGWLGGLGFIALLTLTGVRLLDVLRLHRHPLQNDVFVVTACLTGVLLQSLFIDSTHWRHMWLLLGLAWGLIVASRRPFVVAANSPFTSKCSINRPVNRYPVTQTRADSGHATDRASLARR